MMIYRFFVLLFLFAVACPAAVTVVAQPQERRGCGPRGPEELRNHRFIVEEYDSAAESAGMPAADTEAPHTTKQKDCAGAVQVTVMDMPEETQNRSNMGSVILDTAKSSNYRIQVDPFTPGRSRGTAYRLTPIDYRKPGIAIVNVRDMAGNLTVDTAVYDGRPIRMSISWSSAQRMKMRNGDGSELWLWMKNVGEHPAQLSRILLKAGSSFTVMEPKGGVSLNAGDSVRVTLEYRALLGSRKSGLVIDEDSIGFAAGECAMFVDMVQRQIVEPRIEVTDHDFGSIPVGATSGTWTMEVRNVSLIDGSTLTVYGKRGFARTDSLASFIVVGGDADSSFQLEPGQSRMIQIRARPEDSRDHNDTIVIYSTAMQGDSIGWVKVRGLIPMVYATLFNWGRRRLNYAYGPERIYIHNIGDAPAIITSLDLEGDSSQFTVLNRDDVVGRTIRPGDSCRVDVQFRPTSINHQEARILYRISPLSKYPVVSELSGFGTAPQLFTTDYDFGGMPVGGPEKIYDGPGRIRFWTPANIEFDSVTIIGFEFESDAGVEPDFRWQMPVFTPVVLHAGESYELDGWFRAQAPGVRRARLRAVTADGVDTTSNWYGNLPSSSAGASEGTGEITVSPNPASGDVLLVRCGDASYRGGELSLIDPLGNVVRSARLEAGVKSPVRIDIAGMPAGAYFLRINAGGTITARAVTIVR